MAANCDSEGALPFGWQALVSKRHPDRVYYFNAVTGCSTWDCPELDFSKKNQQGKQENLQSNVRGTKRRRESPPRNTLTLLKQASDKLVKVQESVKQKVPSSQNTSNVEGGSSSKNHAPPTAIVAPVVQNLIKKGKINKPKVSPPNTKSPEVPKQKDLKNKLTTRQEVRSNTPKVSTNFQTEEGKKCRIKKRRIVTVDLTKDDEDRQAVASTSKSKDDDDKDTEDIEMFDVSMECIQDLKLKNDTVFDPLATYYIVIDTNVLISKLNLIDELKDTPLDGCGPPHIFIPWIVIEELDKLKSSRASKGTMRAACEAVRYLNSVLSKHPRFHGQSPAEAEAWAKSYSKVNDDKILECCMALGDKMSKEKVILLTNDKNLVNKALICGINVHDWMSMMEKVKPDVVFNGSKRNGKRNSFDKEHQNVDVAGDASKATDSLSKEHDALRNKRDHCKREIHTLMSSARQLLKDVLADFIKQEMLEAYGEVWLSFPVELKLLKGLFEVIKKYWKMVFSEFFNEKDKRNFELLHEKVRRPEGFLGDKEECLIILSAVEDIFRQIKRRNPKNKDIPIEKIQDLRVICVDTFTKSSELENSMREAEFKDVHAVFEQNWGIMNQLCGLIMDFSKVPHDFQYEKPEKPPSEMDFRLLMCNFYPAVQQIKDYMTNMVDLVSKNKPSHQSFKKLSHSLLQFIPSLKIPCEMVPHSRFSFKALEKFCTHPQNREMIEIGCKQINKFHTKLDEALNSMMISNFSSGAASPENMLLD